MYFYKVENLGKRLFPIRASFLCLYLIKFFAFKSLLFINLSYVIYASTFSEDDLNSFNTSLKIAARNIADQVLAKDEKIIIAVFDILNFETQVQETRGDLLEEQFTELLYEMIPDRVVPYFEILSIRLELRNRYPEIKKEHLTENILKLTDADWLVTGTYENNLRTINVSLKLFDLNDGNIIWDTVVNSKKEENTIVQKTTNLDPLRNSFEREILFESDTKFSFAQISSKNKDELLKIPRGMVKIPEGEFIMGSDFGGEDELPDHLVFINSFYLDKYEVTNMEFTRCLICERGTGGFDTKESEKPVVYVDWLNADAFCKSKNKRLPTEAEWEYAARAGNKGEYSFGEDIDLLENFAWFESNTIGVGIWGAKKVGSKKANQWGLFDLHGNVMEWVQNYYKQDYFASVRQQKNPIGPLSPLNAKYPLRVVRGGAWGGLNNAGFPQGVRASKRYSFVEWTRSFQIGFRCAMDIN